MTLKKYQQIKIIIVIIIALVFSQSFIYQNLIFPIITLIIGSLIIFLLRRQVKEIISDERDLQIAGKSAGLAIQIYSWFAVLTMIILNSFKNINPYFEPAALTLAYSTCFLIFTYSLVFKFYSRIKFTKNKIYFIIFTFIFAFILGILSIRLFSGEDNWVCQKGEWVKHGNPDFSTPTIPCK